MIDRKTPPHFTSNFSLTLPKPEIAELANGIKLFWIREVQQEVVKIELIFNAGKWFETQNGVSFFTSQLLDKGTKNKSSKEIADFLDQFGAQIEISPGLDYTSLSLYTLTRYLNKLLPILHEIIEEANFPAEELELAKSIQIQNLKINNEKTNFVASKLIRQNIFGKEHPYGRSIEELDVIDLSQNELVKFFHANFYPFQIYITGNISAEEYTTILNSFSTLGKADNNIPQFKKIPRKRIETINKDNSVQSSIRIGKSSIKSSHQDYFGLLMINHILGGYFGSRLMKNIREEKGLTYGIYSSINSFKTEGFFSIGAEVNKENIELTVTEISKEIQRLIQEPIPDQELVIAKNHLMGTLQLDIANPFSVSERIKNIHLNNLPNNFYDLLLEHIQKVSVINLQQISQIHLRDSDFYKVIVG